MVWRLIRRQVAYFGDYFGRAMSGWLAQGTGRRKRQMVASSDVPGAWSNVLSPRERQVALLVTRGLANKEIACELGLSVGTVKLHVHSILLKLGMQSRHTLVTVVSGRAVA
jgi:two-component system nitrate/nitrite response regulator NarP